MTSSEDTIDHWPELGKALEWLWEQQQKTQPPNERVWRLYYQGQTPQHVNQGPPWPETELPYIEVTAAQAKFACSPNHLVIDECLIEIDRYRLGVLKLVESEQGEYGTTQYMSLLVRPGDDYEPVKRYSRHS